MKEFLEHVPEGIKIVADNVSWVAVILTLAKFLPAVAALFSICWYAIRIYESDTFQKWFNKGEAGDEA